MKIPIFKAELTILHFFQFFSFLLIVQAYDQ